MFPPILKMHAVKQAGALNHNFTEQKLLNLLQRTVSK